MKVFLQKFYENLLKIIFYITHFIECHILCHTLQHVTHANETDEYKKYWLSNF